MMKTMTARTMTALFLLALPLTLAATAGAAPAAPPAVHGATAAQSPTVEGTWTSRVRDRDDRDRVQLSLEVDERGTWQMGFGIDADDLRGLSLEQASGTVADVRFELVREAGTIAFEGSIRNGRGAGLFTFTPDADWVRRMADLGYDDLSDRRVLAAATRNMTIAWVQDLRQLGYAGLSEDDLFAFSVHGVTADFIRAMNDLGYADIPADDLVRLRIHGVTPDWVREVRRAMGGF